MNKWEQASLFETMPARGAQAVRDTATDQRDFADRLQTAGAPLLRLLAVLDRAA